MQEVFIGMVPGKHDEQKDAPGGANVDEAHGVQEDVPPVDMVFSLQSMHCVALTLFLPASHRVQ